MPGQSKLRGAYLIFLLISAAPLRGQINNHEALQRHLVDAQQVQRTGKLSEAAEQYRAFLADALGELAMGYGVARNYTRAAALFEEALALQPNSSALLLDSARAALMTGDLAHAKTLATEFIREHPDDHKKLAQAHQVLGRTLLKLNMDHEARKELEAAVALDPTFPNGYDLAVACLDLNDEKCAVQIFDEMEKSYGDTAEIHLAFGRAYGDSDSQPRALEQFRRAIAENPRLPGAHYLLAAALLATGGDENRVRSAEMELKKELVISPNDSLPYAALGRLALNRNNYPEAERYLERSVLLDPQNPDAYLYLGQMYFATRRFTEAELRLRRCIVLTTDVSRNRYQVQKAHYLLGRILIQKGQQDPGLAELNLARELSDRTLAQDKSKLAALMETESPSVQVPAIKDRASSSDAVAASGRLALRRVEARREQVRFAVADSYNNLGAIAATNDDYPSAISYFKRAAEWNPSLDGLDYNWARAAFAGSQFSDVIGPLSRYLKLHPEDTGARSVMGISQFMIGNYPGCMETLQPVIGKPDLVSQAEYAYAESLVRTGQTGLGMERLRALERSNPEIPDVHRSLGEALRSQGEKQKAVEEFRTAIQLSPRDADAHYDLGKIELEGGDTAAAVPQLETAVRLSPDQEEFHHELADAYTAALRPADAQKEMETCKLLRAHAQNSTLSRQVAASEQ